MSIENINAVEDFANQPWTEQPGGCGKPGHGIKIPMKFINLDLSLEASEGGRRLYKNSWELRLKGNDYTYPLVKALVTVNLFIKKLKSI